ncbi:MAG: YfhO family protein [Candidatus Omnitrophica bacterium]|nr:YfhO family protein [Candidatus Omnitrophota bacterium]
MPPYGNPINEISDLYWPTMVDIAHAWRTFDFGFWRREVAGGLNLFVTGQYPLLNPTNFMAWFLSDDAFFLEKMIEPYVIGFFFMTVLLWDVFRTRWYVAVFGGFAYMGLLLCKMTPMIESSYFLYGCGLFPGMVLVVSKLAQRHVYLAALGAGCMLALQVIMEGVTQLPQLVIWWNLLAFLYFSGQIFQASTGEQRWELAKQWVTVVGIFVVAVLGMGAVQMVPSMHYFHYESGRQAGYYAINNFDLFKPGHNNAHCMTRILMQGLVEAGHPRMKVLLGLFLGCVAVAFAHWGRIFDQVKQRRYVYLIWATTIIFFLIPNTALLLSQLFPVFEKLFTPLTYFSFHYALHTLDFCIILTACLIINNDTLSLRGVSGWTRRLSGWFFLLLALGVGLLPLLVHWFPQLAASSVWPFKFFDPGKESVGVKILIRTAIILFILSFRPRHIIVHAILAFILLGIGFMAMYECFKWYDKGCRTSIEQYQFDTPEHQYYMKARGKYIIPYRQFVPQWIANNYNLLYGVHGTSGLVAAAPRRIIKFVHYYNHRHDIDPPAFKGGASRFLGIETEIPSSFTTYFPVDFTLVIKTTNFLWKGFNRVVVGKEFDVYERSGATPQVYFGDNIQTLDLRDLILKFDEDRTSTVYVDKEDAKAIPAVTAITEPDQPVASEFLRKPDGSISFQVHTQKGTFVVVPERYASGWNVRVDGQKVRPFPAYYLFIGVYVPPGTHQIVMQYATPWLLLGAIINVAVLAGSVLLLRKYFAARKNLAM